MIAETGDLMLAFGPLAALGIGAGASLLGNLIGGKAASGDKERAAALQEEAMRMERERQATLENRWNVNQPIRNLATTQLLNMGSTENPFSRRLSDSHQAAIMSGLKQAQEQQAPAVGAESLAKVREMLAAIEEFRGGSKVDRMKADVIEQALRKQFPDVADDLLSGATTIDALSAGASGASRVY